MRSMRSMRAVIWGTSSLGAYTISRARDCNCDCDHDRLRDRDRDRDCAVTETVTRRVVKLLLNRTSHHGM
jgi:hypothetical protein